MNATTSSPKPSGLVGTWRWVRVDRQPIEKPFYVRYYPNGATASWPAPEGWSTTNGVSHGRYHLEQKLLVVETGAGKDDPKSRMEIKNDEMVLINDGPNRLIYHRVVPDLQPGKFPTGSNR